MGLYHGPYKPLKASWHSFACRWRQKRYPSEHAQTRRILHGAQTVRSLVCFKITSHRCLRRCDAGSAGGDEARERDGFARARRIVKAR